MIVVTVETGNIVRAEPGSVDDIFCLYLISAFGSECINFPVIGYRCNLEISNEIGPVIHSVADGCNRKIVGANYAGGRAKQRADYIF